MNAETQKRQTMKTCAIRVDGGPQRGGGHLVRCLALAGELMSRGWQCAIHTAPESIEILDALNTIRVPVHVLSQKNISEIQQMSEVWPNGVGVVLVDHYNRGADFENDCRSMATFIVSIDDGPSRPHASDMLFDPTASRTANEYGDYVLPHTQTLCGSAYALLRAPFHKARQSALAERRERRGLNRVLVTMGMGNTPVVLNAVLDAIEGADIDARFDFVCGPDADNHTDYRQRLGKLRQPGRYMNAVPNMETLMVPADLSIGTPGATSWERCCLGLPAILCLVADNQLGNGHALEAAGAARVLDWREEPDSSALARHLIDLASAPARVREMSEAATALCDGKGAWRVATAIESLNVH